MARPGAGHDGLIGVLTGSGNADSTPRGAPWKIQSTRVGTVRPMTISWEDFEKVALVTGTIVQVDDFPEARRPAYKLRVDIGGGVIRKSSAQITHLYSKEELVGKQVICVTNFPPRQVANFMSEILVTGFYDDKGQVILAVPDKPVENGLRLA